MDPTLVSPAVRSPSRVDRPEPDRSGASTPASAALRSMSFAEAEAALSPAAAGGPIQRTASGDAASSGVAPTTGGGSPLPAALQHKMARSFGTDFSDVRVSVGPAAAQMGAVAYAQGDTLQFSPGAYDPGSQRGQALIGHELAHVVQQRAGRVAVPQGKGAPIVANPALESEADRAGERAAAGLPAGIGGGGAAVGAGRAPVQRYTVVNATPGENKAGYSGAGEEHFESQAIERSTEQEKSKKGKVTGTTYKSTWTTRFADLPPVRVSEGGKLAIEHTSREPKTFYAAPDVIAESNRRLDGIDSPMRLAKTSKTLKTPVDPRSPESTSTTVLGVVPSAKVGGTYTPKVNECNVFALELTNGLGRLLVQGEQDEKPYGAPFKLGHGTDKKLTPYEVGDFFTGETSPQQIGEQHDQERPAESQEEILERMPPSIRKAHTEGRLPKNVSALGYATPKVIEAIATTLGENGSLDAKQLDNLIEQAHTLETSKRYGRMQRYRTDDNESQGRERAKALGLNEYAQPEVGEAFTTVSLMPRGVDTGGGALDFRHGDSETDQLVDQRLEHAKKQSNGLLEVAMDGLEEHTKRTWTWHAAAVVARHGGDSVTLENYNRQTGNRWELESLYKTMVGDLKEFLDTKPKVRDKLEQTKEVSAKLRLLATKSSGWAKRLGKVKVDIEGMNQNGNDAWYFQMYGPANEEGGDQSFHGVWKGENVNATTIRLGASSSNPRKTKAKTRVTQLAEERRRTLKGNVSEEGLQEAVTKANLSIDQAKSLTEISQAVELAQEEISKVGPAN